jgi:hypothetical protein
MHSRFLGGATVILGAFVAAAPALAGPPLLCHPYDIGTAQSLPWGDTNDNRNWFQGRNGYDIQHLVSDTEALLTPSTPVIVRMETLRRAVLYASKDLTVTRTLLRRMSERAAAAESAGQPAALAYLDAAYVTEAIHEVGMLGDMSEFRDRASALRDLAPAGAGYILIQKGLTVTPDDPAMHFAAALIAAGTNRQAYLAHATKARAGATANALLARNIQHVS